MPVADPVPRMRINVPNKTGLMLLVSYFFSRNLLLVASTEVNTDDDRAAFVAALKEVL